MVGRLWTGYQDVAERLGGAEHQDVAEHLGGAGYRDVAEHRDEVGCLIWLPAPHGGGGGMHRRSQAYGTDVADRCQGGVGDLGPRDEEGDVRALSKLSIQGVKNGWISEDNYRQKDLRSP